METSKITNHTSLLNALISKHDLKSYLEIGIGRGENFAAINAGVKVGVDPEVIQKGVVKTTSDEFFQQNFNNQKPFDLIFIDGLHTAEQVKRDFENSLKCLSDNGFIVIHDVLPENEEGTKVPRQTKCWWGSVYKFAMTIKESYDDIEVRTYNIDQGCMVVKKSPGKKGKNIDFDGDPLPSWEWYELVGKELMNVTDIL